MSTNVEYFGVIIILSFKSSSKTEPHLVHFSVSPASETGSSLQETIENLISYLLLSKDKLVTIVSDSGRVWFWLANCWMFTVLLVWHIQWFGCEALYQSPSIYWGFGQENQAYTGSFGHDTEGLCYAHHYSGAAWNNVWQLLSCSKTRWGSLFDSMIWFLKYGMALSEFSQNSEFSFHEVTNDELRLMFGLVRILLVPKSINDLATGKHRGQAGVEDQLVVNHFFLSYAAILDSLGVEENGTILMHSKS